MSLMRRHSERLAPVRFEFPDLFRRWIDADWDAGWMRVEEFVDGGMLVIRAELPDIDPDKDVELSLSDGMLTISAHREERVEKPEEGSFRSEFRYGSFTRTLSVPEGVTDEDVTATYKDGILEIRTPLPTETKPDVTKIPVTRG